MNISISALPSCVWCDITACYLLQITVVWLFLRSWQCFNVIACSTRLDSSEVHTMDFGQIINHIALNDLNLRLVSLSSSISISLKLGLLVAVILHLILFIWYCFMADMNVDWSAYSAYQEMKKRLSVEFTINEWTKQALLTSVLSCDCVLLRYWPFTMTPILFWHVERMVLFAGLI